jgi:hypothetical protein
MAPHPRRDESKAPQNGTRKQVMVNRAPVLTLWATVVAEVLRPSVMKR